MCCVLFSAVPSAPPSSISTSSTPTTITVQWGMVPCIHRNGEITDYSVRYGGGGSTVTRPVSGGDTRQATISGLTPSTDYTIEVAAVNNEGTGPYSTGIVERTPGQWMMTVHVLYLINPQRMHRRVTVLVVCVYVHVCICVSVCYHSSTNTAHFYAQNKVYRGLFRLSQCLVDRFV